MTIRARIRAALRAGDQEPAAVARRIIDQLPDAELRDALAVALPYLVRDEIRKIRHDAITPRGRERDDRAAGWRMDPDHESAPDQAESARRAWEASATARRDAGRRGADAAQQQRDRHAALLATPIAISRGVWKQLGDCTAEDLRAVAHNQHERAAENQRRADGFTRLADRLDAAGAATVKAYATGGRPELRESFLAVT